MIVIHANMWLSSRVAERRTSAQKVASLTLTCCAVDYGPEQATHAHLPLSPSSLIWYWWRAGDAPKLGR